MFIFEFSFNLLWIMPQERCCCTSGSSVVLLLVLSIKPLMTWCICLCSSTFINWFFRKLFTHLCIHICDQSFPEGLLCMLDPCDFECPSLSGQPKRVHLRYCQSCLMSARGKHQLRGDIKRKVWRTQLQSGQTLPLFSDLALHLVQKYHALRSYHEEDSGNNCFFFLSANTPQFLD